MIRDKAVNVSYRTPDGAKHSFDIAMNIPENGKDYRELHPEAVKEEWDGLATSQYTTNARNEARRKAVQEATGKAVGVREFTKFLKESGIGIEEAMELLRGKK